MKLDHLVCVLVSELLKYDPGQCESHRPPSPHPAHRLHPSIRWCTHISRWSCCRSLRSDTGSAADSQLHKTPQGILKKTCSPINHLFVCWVFCVFSPTFCAAGSSPAWHARTLSTGRVADAIVTAAAGLVTSFPIVPRGACCQRGTTIS